MLVSFRRLALLPGEFKAPSPAAPSAALPDGGAGIPADRVRISPDEVAARSAADRLKRLIGQPANTTLPFLLDSARLFPSPRARREWLEAALLDHDLRATHTDRAAARIMVARLTSAAIDQQMSAPAARSPMGRLQALDLSHRLAEGAFASVNEPEVMRLANFLQDGLAILETPAEGLSLAKEGLAALEVLPEDGNPVEVALVMASLAVSRAPKPGSAVTPEEWEQLGHRALQEATELLGTPVLQTQLAAVEAERSPGRRRALIHEALSALL
ncbi:MAG: hypothetical protein VKP62_03880 [Candidatus Sericytochromatia bacterium]|nr:hypothetical protein [Candidatus Sericytochromatia bacterium]